MLCNVPVLPGEDEVVRRWWSLPANSLLPLSNGSIYRLLFAGCKGSAAGPDVRDAVFSTLPEPLHAADSTQQVVGDVEFHVQASAWRQHGHHLDARYNNVILHVVLACDDALPTRTLAGAVVPRCSLYDLPAYQPGAYSEIPWPCQCSSAQFGSDRLNQLLKLAGLLRFEEKAHAFIECLRSPQPHCANFAPYDICLVPALAEGLGYGRDRAFFRVAGKRLLGLSGAIREPLAYGLQYTPLDRARLRALTRLVTQWCVPGVWHTLRATILALELSDTNARLYQLRALFGAAGLSLARTDILLVNVVLPFAMAVALQEHDGLLAERTQELYEQHPGLCSNRVTRTMCAQLRLVNEPPGSCRQQGLHHIYQQTCREKRCDNCIVGRRAL